MASSPRVVIAGGGAAGFFAALHLAIRRPDARIVILEQSARVLGKVAISGGGRCNVTHACFDPRRLCRYYPRGEKELRGPFHRWQPQDTVAFFGERGIRLKTETDGRMFPVTDDSATIVDCLTREASRRGIEVRLRAGLQGFAAQPNGGFRLQIKGGAEPLACDALMLATGGLKEGSLADSIRQAGHSITPLAPSLFTFHIDDPRLAELAGLAVEEAEVAVEGTSLRQEGPVLVTHWGLSGPAILRLSAWGARELQASDYRFTLTVNWVGTRLIRNLHESLNQLRTERGKQAVASHAAFGLPRRLWQRLTAAAGIDAGTIWSQVPKNQERALREQLSASRFAVSGKSLNKEEFVTCGGVDRREIDFRTMESRQLPGLYFGGELVDLDGITGGFNLQAAWTTGFLAGQAIAERSEKQKRRLDSH